jgi:hypothetical protein
MTRERGSTTISRECSRSSTVNSFDEGGGGACDGPQAASAIDTAIQIRSKTRVRNPTPLHDALIAL